MVKIGDLELPDFPLLLAPMEDVSDPLFRALCKENGADVVYTEFISSEGLIRDAAKSIIFNIIIILDLVCKIFVLFFLFSIKNLEKSLDKFSSNPILLAFKT